MIQWIPLKYCRMCSTLDLKKIVYFAVEPVKGKVVEESGGVTATRSTRVTRARSANK